MFPLCFTSLTWHRRITQCGKPWFCFPQVFCTHVQGPGHTLPPAWKLHWLFQTEAFLPASPPPSRAVSRQWWTCPYFTLHWTPCSGWGVVLLHHALMSFAYDEQLEHLCYINIFIIIQVTGIIFTCQCLHLLNCLHLHSYIPDLALMQFL